MTTAFPDGEDAAAARPDHPWGDEDHPDAAGRAESIAGGDRDERRPGSAGEHNADDRSGSQPMGEDEVSRRFSAIVSGLSGELRWDNAGVTPLPGDPPPDPVAERQIRRELRRQQRRMERTEQVHEQLADEARRRAQDAEDDDHFVPDEPPALVAPRMRTVVAAALVIAGVVLLLGPSILSISPTAVLVFGAALIVTGSSLLVAGLRGHPDDDGSRV